MEEMLDPASIYKKQKPIKIATIIAVIFAVLLIFLTVFVEIQTLRERNSILRSTIDQMSSDCIDLSKLSLEQLEVLSNGSN